MCVYGGHRDGVWEVSHARNGLPVIGTASAGMKLACSFDDLYLFQFLANNNLYTLKRVEPFVIMPHFS